ncbi:hypothetical protein [Glutamicibacter soli]
MSDPIIADDFEWFQEEPDPEPVFEVDPTAGRCMPTSRDTNFEQCSLTRNPGPNVLGRAPWGSDNVSGPDQASGSGQHQRRSMFSYQRRLAGSTSSTLSSHGFIARYLIDRIKFAIRFNSQSSYKSMIAPTT